MPTSRLLDTLFCLLGLVLLSFWLAIVLSVLFACLAILTGSIVAIFTLLHTYYAGEPITVALIVKLYLELARETFSLVLDWFLWLVAFILVFVLATFPASLISGIDDSTPLSYDPQHFTLTEFREEVKRRELEAQAKGLRVYKETFMMSRQLEIHQGSADF